MVDIVWLCFGIPMGRKNADDDAGNCASVIVGEAFSSVRERDEVIKYILGVEVDWGDLLTEFMGCSDVKARGIHGGKAREACNVVDEVIDTFEHWCIWGIIVARHMVGGVHEIRAGILHNM